MSVVLNTTPRRKRGQAKGRGVEPHALAEIRALLGDRPRRRDLLIEFLHLIQDRHGHLSAAHLAALARELGLSQVEVFEVASFYHHFDVVKEGETAPPALTVRVCESVSCALFGAQDLIARLEATLGPGVRVQRVPCVGRCAEAPVAVVNQLPIGSANAAKVEAAIAAGHTRDAPP
ncbi:MAG: NAD(P)H-dependent oxidoreductase subunit E, partial [Thiotrichales bacterium]